MPTSVLSPGGPPAPHAHDAARHRAPGMARTPLDDAADLAARHLVGTARRATAVAGTSGLLVSVLAGPAAAGPVDRPAVPNVDTASLTAPVRAALQVAPVVSVPADAAWSFDVPALTVVADPPEPEPEPEPVREATSRSSEREAAPEAPAATGAPVPASAVGSAVIEIAARYVGTPYVYGGTTPDGFDCSGFTSYVFAQLGITLPRTSSEQRYAGVEVPADQAQPGDLVWSPGHIGIYAGDGTMIDSPQPGETVRFRSMYQSNPVFIRVG